MRELTINEVAMVGAGADSLLGITELAKGFKFTGIVGAVTSAYGFGYAIGMGFNNVWEGIAGDTLGGSIYEFVNC